MERKENIVAIVQARSGSSRFPNKVFSKLGNNTLIEWVFHRVSMSKYVNSTILATTVNSKDDDLESWAIKKGIKFHRGSEEDVLERFYLCARRFKASHIVRITADDPLKDPQIIDRHISILLENRNLDYCSNTLEPSYPEGLDVEVFTLSSLEKAYKNSTKSSEKEHVTPYIWKNTDLFNIYNVSYKEDLSHLRWTIDWPEDLVVIDKIMKGFDYNIETNYEEIIQYVKSNKRLLSYSTDSKIQRNQGYLKSLELESEN